MDTLSRVRCFTTTTSSSNIPFPRISPTPRSTLPTVSVLRTSPRPVSGVAEEDVLQMFFKERKLSRDFISKASDIFWQREVQQFVDADAGEPANTPQQAEQDGSISLKHDFNVWVPEAKAVRRIYLEA